MICPACQRDFYGLVQCEDKVYRCLECKRKPKPAPAQPGRGGPYPSLRGRVQTLRKIEAAILRRIDAARSVGVRSERIEAYRECLELVQSHEKLDEHGEPA